MFKKYKIVKETITSTLWSLVRDSTFLENKKFNYHHFTPSEYNLVDISSQYTNVSEFLHLFTLKMVKF